MSDFFCSEMTRLFRMYAVVQGMSNTEMFIWSKGVLLHGTFSKCFQDTVVKNTTSRNTLDMQNHKGHRQNGVNRKARSSKTGSAMM